MRHLFFCARACAARVGAPQTERDSAQRAARLTEDRVMVRDSAVQDWLLGEVTSLSPFAVKPEGSGERMVRMRVGEGGQVGEGEGSGNGRGREAEAVAKVKAGCERGVEDGQAAPPQAGASATSGAWSSSSTASRRASGSPSALRTSRRSPPRTRGQLPVPPPWRSPRARTRSKGRRLVMRWAPESPVRSGFPARARKDAL